MNSRRLSRRDAVGQTAKIIAAISALPAVETMVGAQVKTPPEQQSPLQQPPTQDPCESKGNARQQDALNIRNRAACQGVFGAPAERSKGNPGGQDPPRATQYSKALQRAGEGDRLLPAEAGFNALRDALGKAYERTLTREEFPDAPDTKAIEGLIGFIGDAKTVAKFKFTNPLGGLAFELEGLDPASSYLPEAPAFDTDQTAAEMAEAYWMALLRDVPFSEFDPGSPTERLRTAIADLNNFSWFRNNLPLTPANFLRAKIPGNVKSFEGVDVGPYISQFLLRGTVDPGDKSITPADGVVNFGSLRLPQKQRTVVAGKDYLQDPTPKIVVNGGVQQWWAVQNGDRSNIGKNAFDGIAFIRTPRDGANYVHFDEIYQEYLIAASILLSGIPRVGDTIQLEAQLAEGAGTSPAEQPTQQISESSIFQPKLLNYGNPYRFTNAQVGFATFGVTHILTLMAEVSTRAHKAGWFHKWQTRRLRPEEFGARVQAVKTGGPRYGIHQDLVGKTGENVLSQIVAMNRLAGVKDSYLLPMAFPEGCPTHPAYPSGHATVAGASVTVLKAMFNEAFPITNVYDKESDVRYPPVFVVNASGCSLEDYDKGKGKDDPSRMKVTVGGELNKLASNIVFFRGMAGVHWRSDSIEGVLLGERVAIELLVEQTQPTSRDTKDGKSPVVPFYRERWLGPSGKESRSPFFRFTMFDGRAIDIADGMIQELEKGGSAEPDGWKPKGKPLTYEAFVAQS